MRRTGSFLWILFLLAALFVGPSLILKTTHSTPQTLRPLRLSAEREELVDAPRPLSAEELKHLSDAK